jgi:hypothetical protein
MDSSLRHCPKAGPSAPAMTALTNIGVGTRGLGIRDLTASPISRRNTAACERKSGPNLRVCLIEAGLDVLWMSAPRDG